MVDTKSKTNEDTKTSEDVPQQHAKKLEYIALFKSTNKSEWSLYPQIFISKAQAEHKLELTMKPEKVHVLKVDFPE